jgi:hypothetical protein
MDIALNEIEVPYKIKFTNKNPVPVEQLVTSLLAYEKLLKRVGPFIEEACEGIIVIEINVLVSKIESGSLYEDLLVKVLFKTEENYEQAKEVIVKMFENNKVLTGAVCLGVAAYIGFGVRNAIIGQGNAGKPMTHIDAHHGAIVQTGGTMNISAQAIDKILNRTTDKKKASQEAIAALAPAQLEDDASVVFNESDDLKITPEFIKETPEVYEPPELEQQNETILKTKVEIWASDKDSQSRSWAGIVPGKIDKRIKFVLDEAVDPNKVHGKRDIIADIIIVSSYVAAKKEFVPKKVEILRVYKPEKKTPL